MNTTFHAGDIVELVEPCSNVPAHLPIKLIEEIRGGDEIELWAKFKHSWGEGNCHCQENWQLIERAKDERDSLLGR